MSKQSHIENYEPKNLKFRKIFNKLKQYACDHFYVHVKVGQKYQDISDLDSNLIRLKLRKDEEKILFYFLHELGHVRLCCNHDYEKKFSNMLTDLDARRYKTNAYRIGRFQEEIQAWEEAMSLVKELKINLDFEKMEREKNSCLKSYARWAAK